MVQQLQAYSSTAGQLFSGARFVVPEYQREYAWGNSEVREFWSDLVGSLSGDSYFLGLVIVTEEENRFQLVDGQQRILTLTLLADALRRAARALGRKALAERLESTFLYAIQYDSDEVEPRLRLADRSGDRALRDALDAGNEPETVVAADIDLEFEVEDEESVEGDVSRRIARTHAYLSRSVAKDLATTDAFKRLGEWTEFLLEKLYFAVFQHPNADAAFKVFEVVNTRGKELTTADLLKNYVMKESTAADRDQNYRRWLALRDVFRIARLESQFVQYIRHVITVRHGFVLPSDLYRFISLHYVGSVGADQLLLALEDQLDVYQQIMDPSAGGAEEDLALRVFAAMEALGLRNVRPMLLALSRVEDPLNGMVALLRLVVRRIVVGNFGTGNVERRFSNAAHSVYTGTHWRRALEGLGDLDAEGEDFEVRLAERPFNKEVLHFLRASIVQQSVTPELDGFLHFVRPRIAGDWPGFTDEDFRAMGSTLGNTFISRVDRRLKGSNTPAGFSMLMLPTRDQMEPLGAGISFQSWSSGDAKVVGRELAKQGRGIWFAAD